MSTSLQFILSAVVVALWLAPLGAAAFVALASAWRALAPRSGRRAPALTLVHVARLRRA